MGELRGLLVLDKPGGMTSRDAVNRVQRWFPRKTKIGHTGTLDPLATGVLVLCLGAATRLADHVQRMGKVYTSTFVLGASSDSDDADGTITCTPGASDPGRERVEAELTRMVGTLSQTPPAYSAAHVAGQRAYDLARRGEEVLLEARTVEVYSIALLRYAYPELEVEVRCGKGTYIRSLARDLGEALSVGAYVSALRRTGVGPFTPTLAVSLDATADEARAGVLSVEMALGDLPRVDLAADDLRRLRQGQSVPGCVHGECAVFDGTSVAAIAEGDGMVLRPLKVLA